MPEEKEIILKISTDASQASADVDHLKAKLQDVDDTVIKKPFKTFRQEIKEAITDAKRLGEQFGSNSNEFVKATAHVAELKEQFKIFNETVKAFNPANKLQGLVSTARGATGAIEGVTAAMQFMGDESENTVQTIAKLQQIMAFSEALNSVKDMEVGLKGMAGMAKNAFASMSKGDVVGLAIIGITALSVAIYELSTNTKNEEFALEALTKNMDKIKEATASAVQKVNDVKNAFEQAREGVITKKEALKVYNDTLGDTMGKTDSLATAEKNYLDKADLYIKVMGLKIEANTLFQASAAESAKALTANEEDQTTWIDKTLNGIKGYVLGGGNAIAGNALATLDNIKAQQKGVTEVIEASTHKANILFNAGAAKSKEMQELAKKANLILDPDKGTGNKGTESQAKKDLDELRNFELKTAEEIRLAKLSGIEKELQQLEDKYKKEYALAKKYKQDTKKLDELFTQESAAIYQKQRLLNQPDIGTIGAVPVAKAGIDDIGTNMTAKASHASSVAGTAAIYARTNNQLNNSDSLKEALAKTKAIFDAEVEEENKAFAEKMVKAKSNHDEEERLKAEHYAKMSKLTQEYTDADIALSDTANEKKKATLDNYAVALNQIGDIIGKQTVAGKAFAIASATISTYQSAVSSYNAMATIPVVGPVLGIVAAAAAIKMGIDNVKAIVAVKVPNSGSSGGSIPAAIANAAPQINASAAQRQAIQDVRVTNNGQAPIRAYITNGDLQTNAQKNRFLNNVTSF